MPPRRRQAATRTAEAYNYAGAEKLNNPTSETALGMEPEDLADQFIPEPEEEGERIRHPRLQWNRGAQTDHSRTFGPLYIHDKVSPEQFLKTLTKTSAQRDMWALLNGLPEDAAAKPYEYSGHWTNRLIRATAQRAMASLLYKDGMRGKVNLIYMDPPYNKSFRSNFQASADTPETEEDWDDLPNDPMAIKAFRDTYRDGVHSYLDGLYEQLTLGRELLHEKGSFIVQIGADNVHEVVMLMAEVFGRENHVATVAYRTGTNQSTGMLPEIGNWLVWFAKDKTQASEKYRQLYEPLSRKEKIALMSSYAMCELNNGTCRTLTAAERDDPSTVPEGARIFQRERLDSSGAGRSDPFLWQGTEYYCHAGGHWRVSHEGLETLAKSDRLVVTPNGGLRWRKYEDELPGRHINAIWTDTPGNQDKQYVVETPPKVLERCILMTTDPGDLVLDLTCGSGAMPFQAETWGRRWIEPAGTYKHDPQGGFVVERQLRVSAATLAYGHRDEEPIKHPDRTVRVNNRTRVASPFTVESDSPYRSITPGEQNGHHQDADVETILQTTGFTLPEPEADNPVIKRITDSLETSGIGQPGKGRYKVENLAPSDVMDVTHTGTLIAPDGDRHPAYFYIGREDEVISAVQTRNAATAIANVDPSCRHLVMVGFGRDGDAHSVGRYRPGMTILQVQTSRDLQLPWLKEEKTDTAFTIISEPEVRLHQLENGRVQLEVVGLNCFNPKQGVVEVGDARQMMGIMVDTEYDTESFRARLINVRQVGRNQRTLKNLRAAFNREIDSEKWEQMLTTKTIPFELPAPGVKIAVKVIDQTGMEHMTVIDDPKNLVERA